MLKTNDYLLELGYTISYPGNDIELTHKDGLPTGLIFRGEERYHLLDLYAANMRIKELEFTLNAIRDDLNLRLENAFK